MPLRTKLGSRGSGETVDRRWTKPRSRDVNDRVLGVRIRVLASHRLLLSRVQLRGRIRIFAPFRRRARGHYSQSLPSAPEYLSCIGPSPKQMLEDLDDFVEPHDDAQIFT